LPTYANELRLDKVIQVIALKLVLISEK
jgi:hypothetical protein